MLHNELSAQRRGPGAAGRTHLVPSQSVVNGQVRHGLVLKLPVALEPADPDHPRFSSAADVMLTKLMSTAVYMRGHLLYSLS